MIHRFASLLVLLAVGTPAGAQSSVRQATGFTITDVTDTDATISTRLTASSSDASPSAGRIRLRYVSFPALREGQPPTETDWIEVDPASGSAHVFALAGLTPATPYWLNVETTGPGGSPVHGPLRGRFTTAPAADQAARVLFTVAAGYEQKGAEGPRGFETDVSINNLEPAFHSIAETTTPSEFARRVELSRYVPVYSLAPDDGPLRSVRWGKDLQVWFLDAPERADSLKATLAASDATFKLIVSSEPLAGSGKDLPAEVVVLSGGTRWQGHAVDPAIGLREFATGPASDALAGPAPVPPTLFHRPGGGFASVLVDRGPEGAPALRVRLHRPDGEVVHEDRVAPLIAAGNPPGGPSN
jgi:hypothetical protein